MCKCSYKTDVLKMFDRLCPALKAVFEHGLKRSSLLGGPGHPWLFIEEVGVTNAAF